uniref:G_PROTEIN_RECEP_F1_2 domain-containing protein n=1 Tax=Haemonchus contortus TaxID=6289 RepID=A0A7I4YIA3_HAECO
MVCLVGVILNVCCLMVFVSLRSHPLVPALIVLSVCDLLQLTLTVFVLFIPALHDFTNAERFGALALLLAFNCASIWTICYISIKRHKAILRPLSSIHAPSRPFSPLLAIAAAALIFNGSKWAEFRWQWLDVEVDNVTRKFLAHEPSDLAYNETYRQMFDHILYPVLVYLIPLLLLSVLNFRILSHISAQRVAFDHKSRLAQERRSVTLLISIVSLFFFCHTGGLAIRFVDQSKYGDSALFVLLKDCINLLFNINSFANPMLYFLFTRQFRDLRVSFRHFTPSRSGSLPVNVNRGSTCKPIAVSVRGTTQLRRYTDMASKNPYDEDVSDRSESLPIWPLTPKSSLTTDRQYVDP